MSENTNITWTKAKSHLRSFTFHLSQKLSGQINRKGLWSSEGSGEIGPRKLLFRSTGKANKTWTIYDGSTEKSIGEFNFKWKDFQRSKLELSNGKVFYFKSTDIFRGVWSWIKEDSLLEQFTFMVDTPLHRSGIIENNAKDLSAEERDILLLFGLHLQHWINTWMMTIVIAVIAAISG
jgi:hypothetical protein